MSKNSIQADLKNDHVDIPDNIMSKMHKQILHQSCNVLEVYCSMSSF